MQEDINYKRPTDFMGNWLKKDDHVIYVKDNSLNTGTIIKCVFEQVEGETRTIGKAVIKSDYLCSDENKNLYYPVDTVNVSNVIRHNLPNLTGKRLK